MFFKRVRGVILVFFFFWLIVPRVLAASDYVLPYPGIMPGHRLYQIKQVFNQLRRFWAFGNFSRHKYELELADKKLVEAKVLFEYQQYFLGSQALIESNQHFQKAGYYLYKAEEEGKDIVLKLVNFKAAAAKHSQVLEKLKEELPSEFLWQPEKKEATQLNLESIIEEAVKIREI